MKEAIAIFNLDPEINILNWTEDPNIFGYVYFHQEYKNSPVNVEVEIYNLSEGYHGMHIHEKKLNKSNIKSVNCCNELGGHFNPTNDVHGNHVGDLCFNIFSNEKKAHKKFIDNKISLYKNNFNIINRSLIIHKDRDDMGLKNPKGVINQESLKTGNAGARIACSNIVML